MKKIGFILFLLLWIPLVALAAPYSQDPQGFYGSNWRTSFHTLEKEVGLQPVSFDTREFINSYEGVNNKVWNKNGTLRTSFFYHFYQDQLVSGTVKFYHQADHDWIVQYIQSYWGEPDGVSPNGKISFFHFPTTTVAHRNGSSPDDPKIYGQLTFHDASFLSTSIQLQTQKSPTEK